MANRFWVGGTASWDGTAGTKWALTSGGAGGQAVPTASDDVYFDAASGAVTCTVSASVSALSLNFTGFTGTFAGTGGISVFGNVTASTGMSWTHFGNLAIQATSLLTSAGKTLSPISLTSVSSNVTLQDALVSSGAITVTFGTFTTNNYAVTATQLSSSNSNTRTINLGSSTVTLTLGAPVNFTTSTNLTFNAGTSNIICSSASGTLNGGSQVFYNVSFTNTSISFFAITGANTFNNFAVTAPSLAGVAPITFASGQTINGTLSTTGTAGNRRVWFRGETYGIAQTLTINSAPSLTDADFRDIYVIGTAAPISGTRIGDLRGIRGITASTPKTVYWNLAGTQNWSANAWATTSTGTPSTDNFPLAQDTATFTNAGSVTGPISMDAGAVPYTGTVDMSGRTSAMTLVLGAFAIYGNWTNGSGTTLSGSGTLTYSGRNTQTITSAGKTFGGGATIDSYGGSVELADALNIGSSTLIVTNGTFDTKNYNVTAGSLSSNNSNVRTITLGSSTVTLSGAVTFSTATNLTLNAGTSQITIPFSGVTFNGGNRTFYNVSFTSVSSSVITIIGTNTFNNLTLTAPTSAGIAPFSFQNNQTISGNLTCAGATAVRRVFLQSSVLGTTRTLTVNSLSATDCDFRDITIAGTAAGSSPTRAGDCGGNTGITFPAAKTVYWALTGGGAWTSTNVWATSIGGAGDINNFPLAQDTAVFPTGYPTTGNQITLYDAMNHGSINTSAKTTETITLNNTGTAQTFYGDILFGSGTTLTGNPYTLAKRGTQTITSSGVIFNQNITIDSFSGTIQLADALTIIAARTLTLTSGTFDAVNYNVTTGLFAGGGASTLKMGSGTWTLSGIGTVWNMGSAGGFFNLYKGTSNILLSGTTTGDRTFDGSGFSFGKLTIGGATGTSTFTINGSNQFTELASTKTVAHTIALGTTIQTFGAWTVTGTVGNVVTLTGTGTSHILAGACTSGIDYLVMNGIGFAATSPGEFYAGANSTGTAAAPVYRTAKPADSTRYWVGGTGNWSDTAQWSTSSGGSSGASVPRSHDDVVFDSGSNATAYTATVNAVTGGIRTKALTVAGPLTGNLTLAGSAAILGIHGNVTLPATGLTRTYSGAFTLSGSATGRTLTTNGVTLASNTTINGVGCGWTLGSALNIGSSTLTVTNGSFNLSTYNLSVLAFSSNNSNARTIDLGSSTITAASDFRIGQTESTRSSLTLIAGTSQLSSGSQLDGNNQTFYNVSFATAAGTVITLNGANTFNNLSFLAPTVAGVKTLAVSANQTINGTLTFSASTDATMRSFARSDTIGTTRTLTCAAFSGTDADFRDITIAGAAAPVSGTRLGDCKGNSGITFGAGTTKYWNLVGGGNWSATGWAATSGGSPAANNFPLAQDTCLFEATGLNSGATITINAAYNIGTIDMSARTSNTMTLTCAQTPVIYGSWINGTGVTLSGTGTLTFAGRGSQTITNAGRTFTQDFNIDTPSGSVTLQDAFVTNRSSTQALRLVKGTFDANIYNASFTGANAGFNLDGSSIRTIAVGSGTLTIAGTSAWQASTSTNLTVTGAGTISLTSASAKSFDGGGISYSGITLDQGGAGTLTITGNNTFANITNTYKATGATNITMGTSTQTVGSFTASGEAGRVLTVQGTSAASPATLILTSGTVITPDYLTITGVRAYNLVDTWYAGANSTNNGSLGWYFEAGGGGPITAFIIESATSADAQSSTASLTISMSETATAADAAAAGLLYLGTLSESATASDVAEAFKAYLAEISESTTATDLLSASLNLAAAISELTTATDSTAVTSRVTNPTIEEAAQMADTLSGGLLFLSSITEAATAQEIAVAIIVFIRAISEATTAAEVSVAIAVFQAAVPEQVSGADVANALLTVGGAINEALTALDESVGPKTTSPTISEEATTSESLANVYTANPEILELVQGADAAQVVASTFGAISAETASPLDTPQGANTGSSSLSESASVSDSGAAAFIAPTAVSESAQTAESVSSRAVFLGPIVEAASPADSTSVAPSTFSAIALAAAEAFGDSNPAGSIYNAILPVETARATDSVIGAYLWNPIDDNQTPSWNPINDAQTPGWAAVDDNQTPNWQNVNNTQSVTWTPVNDNQTPGWTPTIP